MSLIKELVERAIGIGEGCKIEDEKIILGDTIFNRVWVSLEDINKENIFAHESRKKVKELFDNIYYQKLKDEITEKYTWAFDESLGEFLFLLKVKEDSFYKKFLNKYGDIKYCVFKIKDKRVIKKRGLYIFKKGEEIVYVGRCIDSFNDEFNKRQGEIKPKSCYIDSSSTNCHINSLINEIALDIKLYVAIIEDEFVSRRIQEKLIGIYNPLWNYKVNSML